MLKIKINVGFEMETPILLNIFSILAKKKKSLYIKYMKKTKVSKASSWGKCLRRSLEGRQAVRILRNI